MEFVRRGPATATATATAADDDRRRCFHDPPPPPPPPPPPHGDAMLVIRDALLLQLQMDRIRQEIIMAELAKIEDSMALRSASSHGIVTGDVEWAKLASSSLGEKSMPHRRWPVSLEHCANVDDLYDLKNDGRQGGVESRSTKPVIEDRVCECSRPCCNGKIGVENAAFDEHKLQESNENIQPKEPSVKWELTGITMAVKKPKSPLKWSCAICQVHTHNERQLQEHHAGKKHRSKIATLESGNEATTSQKEETIAEPSLCANQKTSPINWSCSTCQANGTGEADLKEHLNGRTHQQNIEAQSKEGDCVAKNSEQQGAQSQQNNMPQHAEKPPPIRSCGISRANCTSESELGNYLFAKIQALLDEINNMVRNSESLDDAKLPPNIVPQHAEQSSSSDCSICQANGDYQSALENHLGGKIHQLNVEAIHEEAKQMENITPQIAKNQQPPSGWDCNICEAKCYSESQFEHHCSGKKHRKKMEALQGEGEDAKSSSLKMENEAPSNDPDSMSATAEKLEEQMTLYFCGVCNLLCNSENILADHCKGEEHLEKQKLLSFCEACDLQCSSEKMLAHHRTGKKHLKKAEAFFVKKKAEEGAKVLDKALSATSSLETTRKELVSLPKNGRQGLADDELRVKNDQDCPKLLKVIPSHRFPSRRSVGRCSKVKFQRPIGEKRARSKLMRRLGIFKRGEEGNVEFDEDAMDRCVEVLKPSFPPSLIVAALFGSDSAEARGPNGVFWDISVTDIVS